MSKLTKLSLYKWVKEFILTHHLLPHSGRVVVGLSGGKDSILLAYMAMKLKKEGLIHAVKLIHIDHSLREESGPEALKVKNMCESLGWECEVRKVQDKVPTSNIELWARETRYMLLKKYLHKGDVLYVGHHINDSLEWFLRSLFSSSSDKHLGIPLVNGQIRRPLHCLTKKHINFWIKKLQLPYIFDESNEDQRFQRNRIRQNLMAPIEKDFRKSLKHVSTYLNGQARQRNCHAILTCHPYIKRFGSNVVILEQLKGSGGFYGCEHVIADSVKALSSSVRGEIFTEISKLIRAQVKGKRGPFSLSGGVKIYCYPGMLILVNGNGLADLKSLDCKTAQLLSDSQIPGNHPFFTFSKKPLMNNKTLRSDSLHPLSNKVVLSKGWWMRPKSHVQLKVKRTT